MRKHLFSGLFVIATIGMLMPLAVRNAAAQSAPLLAGVDKAILTELALSYRILVNQNVLDAYGHVSIRHPQNPNRFLMARSGEVAPAYVTANDIMEFDLDSNAIDRQGRALHSERFIHGEIYKLRPDVNAVVHSHSRAVIPFGVTKTPLRAIFHNAAFLGAGVPVYEIRDQSGENNDMLVNSKRQGPGAGQGAGRASRRADARPRRCGGRAQPPGGDLPHHLHRGECEPAAAGHDAGWANHVSQRVRGQETPGNGTHLGGLEAAGVGAKRSLAIIPHTLTGSRASPRAA